MAIAPVPYFVGYEEYKGIYVEKFEHAIFVFWGSILFPPPTPIIVY
jgi:hypothetical protein